MDALSPQQVAVVTGLIEHQSPNGAETPNDTGSL